MMIVHDAEIPPPSIAGRRKNIQKMTISSGIPRIDWMIAVDPHLTTRFRETLRSPRISPPRKERARATTARYRVSPTPPSGPFGYRPTKKYDRFSRTTEKSSPPITSTPLQGLEDLLVVEGHQPGDGEGKSDVHQRRRRKRLEPLEGVALHLPRLVHQLGNADRHRQRRVLHQVQELVDERRDG